MTLKPKSLRYSQLGGLTVDFHSPDELTITTHEALCLLVWQLMALSAEEMEAQFTNDEQQTIARYFLALEKKGQQLYERYDKKRSVKAIQRDFKDRLTWLQHCATDGMPRILSDVYGWHIKANEEQPLIDRLILSELKHYDPNKKESTFSKLVLYLGDAALGKPSKGTKEKIEAVVGPINWKALTKEGKVRHKKRFKR